MLIILASVATGHAFALGEQQDASLKATHGRSALIRGQYQDAERLLTEALGSGALPLATQISALGNRGVARWRQGNLIAAIGDFNTALKLSPEDATLYNNRGNVLLELHHYGEGVKDFSQAIALAPGYGPAYNNRGNAKYLLGNHAAAIADYTKAIALMPTSAVPFNGRGKAQLALRRPAGAMRDFSRAIVLNARYGQAYANRAEALMALRRHTDAVDDYSSAIEFGAATARAYLGRAAAYTSLNKSWKALPDLARARERDVTLTAAAAEQTGSLPEKAKHSPAAESPCEGAGHLGEVSPGSVQIADAHHSAESNSLLLRASDKVFIGNAKPDGPADAAGAPCRPDDKQAADPQAAPSGDRPVSMELEGWTLVLTESGQYVATNSDYPKMRLTLEMYGSGDPELLNWQLLHDSLRGVGLMHYYAGRSAEGERLEYIALVDIWAGKVIAIEPARWGERQAEWSWTDRAVVVIDPQGVPSRVQVRDASQVRDATYARPAHLKRIQPILPRFSYRPPRFSYQRPQRMMPFLHGFNPYAFR